ncbi:hypothetical protein JRO89_XS02G0025000 [Xanthoceras sorbifolium]|uniref:Ribosome-binding factor A n=1 Tax=Xanthoceras sorbifolium TaxID=99658 RepID=A0ABQ8IEG0_9ROSI|nr:hypothetical protein JRO89_XS02G0025000 [Xanthoceras sorbifolium]
MSQVVSFHSLPYTNPPPLLSPHRSHSPLSITAVRSGAWTRKSMASVHQLTGSSTQRTTTTTIKCMANPRRVKMVAKQIMRELSDMLVTDKVLQFAVLPEAALGADRYLSSLTTISDVEVSADLQSEFSLKYFEFFRDTALGHYNNVLARHVVTFSVCYVKIVVVKVYVSVFGDDRGKEVAIAGLKSKAKYVRSELGRRMKLRLTPEIRFIEDESLERGSRVIEILDRIKAEKEVAKGQNGEQFKSPDLPQDETDWEGDDPDEDIIYVK